MDTRTLGRILAAQRDLYLKDRDQILFVLAGSFRDAPIGRIFSQFPHDTVRIPAVKRPGQDYSLDEQLLEGKTVAWLISNVSISHSAATRKMLEKGMFLISNPGITADWLEVLHPANRFRCTRNARRILKEIGGDVGGTIHVTAEDGTDLHLKVPYGNWTEETGKREGHGTNGLFGELCTAPYGADGVYVLKPGDFLTNPLNRVREETRLEIRDNHVARITGGEQAAMLINMIDASPHFPRSLCLGEFAFGVNPGRPKRILRSVVAEKMQGSIHIAIGTNSVCLREDCPDIKKFPYGGRYNAGVHIDCIKFGPKVSFNGIPIL